MFKPSLLLLATLTLNTSAARASTVSIPSPSPSPSAPAPTPSPTPYIVTSFSGSLATRYDHSRTTGNSFKRVQESVVFGFTISPRGVFDLVGMIQTGAPYGKKWNTAIDLNDHSKDQLEATLYFKQIFLQKSFKAFGVPTTAQAGILATNQKIGTTTLVGPITALGTNGWSEGARVTVQTHLGDLSVTGGSISDVAQANILKRSREMNYFEIQLSRKVFDSLSFEASGGKYDGSAFFRGAAEYDITLISEHMIRLIQEAFYSEKTLNYSTTLSTDLGALLDKKLAGRVNLDLRYSYIAPNSNFRGQTMNDLVLKGHVLSTALYGKVDKTGRLHWFTAKDFLDVKRVQAGITWKFKGGNKK